MTLTLPLLLPATAVYDFARRVENLPQWASGLAHGVWQVDGEWFADSPMGQVRIAMAPENADGILDHEVELPDGTRVHNVFRVEPAGAGCVLRFVVTRTANQSEADFEADVAHVRRDLETLKRLLESSDSP